ncbi:hypothetical protein ACHAO7_011882 [Fusarium culmorum]
MPGKRHAEFDGRSRKKSKPNNLHNDSSPSNIPTDTQIRFGLEIETYTTVDALKSAGLLLPADYSDNAYAEAMQNELILTNLAEKTKQLGHPASVTLWRRFDEYTDDKVLLATRPPRQEVYALRGEIFDVRVPGRTLVEEFPARYEDYNFKPELGCDLDDSQGEQAVEMTKPVYDEEQWSSGFPDFFDVLAMMEDEVKLRFGPSFGTHVNISFAQPEWHPLLDKISYVELSVKRFLSLCWLLERHLLSFLCPGRLLTDRDERDNRDDIATQQPAITFMADNIPELLNDDLENGIALIWSCNSLSEVASKVCVSRGDTNRGKRAVHVHVCGYLQPMPLDPGFDDSSSEHDDIGGSALLGGGVPDEDECSEREDSKGSGSQMGAALADKLTERTWLVEVRYAPATGDVSFNRVWISVVLAIAKLSHGDGPAALFKLLFGQLNTVVEGGQPSVRRCVEIVDVLRAALSHELRNGLQLDEQLVDVWCSMLYVQQ